MNDAIKHTIGTTISGAGFYGWITLSQASDIAGLTCGCLGSVAAICTINSWYRKRLQRKKKKLFPDNESTT